VSDGESLINADSGGLVGCSTFSPSSLVSCGICPPVF